MRVEHRDKRYEDSGHPAGGQGKALSPRGQLGRTVQDPSPWRLGEIQQITRKEFSVMLG